MEKHTKYNGRETRVSRHAWMESKRICTVRSYGHGAFGSRVIFVFCVFYTAVLHRNDGNGQPQFCVERDIPAGRLGSHWWWFFLLLFFYLDAMIPLAIFSSHLLFFPSNLWYS